MRNLLIIGARALGRCVFQQIISGRCELPDVRIFGFLDDDPNALDGFAGVFPPILSSVEAYEVQEGDVFVCALGNPFFREKYTNIIKGKGGKLLTIIWKTAIIPPSAIIGEGCLIGDYVVVGDNVSIGGSSIITNYCVLGHDVCIGKYSFIEAFCFLGGYISIGSRNYIHAHSSISSHTMIGDDVSIGMGSVVLRNVENGEHVFGNPAKKVLLWK